MLTSITPPTTSNFMAPETVLERLKLPESELADITDQVEEASGLVARYLGFRPEFGTWQETFTGVNGDRLYLGARPAWAVLSVMYREGDAHASDTYRLERGPYGESSLIRGGVPWDVYTLGHTDPWFWEGASLHLGGISTSIPDWTVQYTAGWWLEEMTGTMPVGVEPLPAEIRADFLKVIRWIRATATTNTAVRRMKDDGAEVEFFAAGDQDVDPITGIPCACTRALSLYRRAT